MKFYLVLEISEILRLSESQVYALINAGKLKAHRMTTGRQGGIRVSDDQLQRFLRESQMEPASANGHIR